jgi:hypothetical protein
VLLLRVGGEVTRKSSSGSQAKPSESTSIFATAGVGGPCCSWWSFIGSTAFSVSTIAPSWLAEDASSVALIALHFVVAGVVIGGFASTLPVCRQHAGVRVTQSPHGAR